MVTQSTLRQRGPWANISSLTAVSQSLGEPMSSHPLANLQECHKVCSSPAWTWPGGPTSLHVLPRSPRSTEGRTRLCSPWQEINWEAERSQPRSRESQPCRAASVGSMHEKAHVSPALHTFHHLPECSSPSQHSHAASFSSQPTTLNL